MENKNKVNKVLLFLPTLLGGGAEETFTHLAKYLASKNLKVYLVVGTNKSSNLYSLLIAPRAMLHLIMLVMNWVNVCIHLKNAR